MQVRELSIAGALELTPRQFPDDRGVFLEYFRQDVLAAATGRELDLRQANCSVSAAGTLRGIHFSDVPPGQAKYVTCTAGAFLDVVVDIRVGSPSFGRWDAVILDDVDRRAVFVPEGLGHAVMSLADGSTLLYLCSSTYAPALEHGVNPLDPEMGIDWPRIAADGAELRPLLSEKDAAAPMLREAESAGLLPCADVVRDYIASLR